MTDTDLIARADAALDGVTPDRCYLIKKNGLYYRPNCKGYTTSATQAGRYTLDEEIKESHPNGPDGPRDGMTYQHENDARDDDWLVVRELRQLVPALRDALAAALTREECETARANEWRDEYRAVRKERDLHREKNAQLVAERDAALTRAELAECHAEAMEAEQDRLRGIVADGASLIRGDAVGAEWKRGCATFLRRARAALTGEQST